MKQPVLERVPIPKAFETGCVYITMRPEQWDSLLAAAYERGHTLLVVRTIKGKDMIVKAYRKQPAG